MGFHTKFYNTKLSKREKSVGNYYIKQLGHYDFLQILTEYELKTQREDDLFVASLCARPERPQSLWGQQCKERTSLKLFLHCFKGRAETQTPQLLPQNVLQHGCESITQLVRYMNKEQISVQVLDDTEATLCEGLSQSP